MFVLYRVAFLQLLYISLIVVTYQGSSSQYLHKDGERIFFIVTISTVKIWLIKKSCIIIIVSFYIPFIDKLFDFRHNSLLLIPNENCL